MIKARRIGHVTFESADVERLADYYTQVLGLTLMARDTGNIYLASTLDHHSVVLRHGSESRCVRIALQVIPGSDLADLAKRLGEHGVRAERRQDSQPSIGEILLFQDPKGTEIEIFSELGPAAQRFQPAGIVPHKLGHVAFCVTDVQKVVKFYTEVLGFRISDRMGDSIAWLRCGPDHHTVNFFKSKVDRMHHIAFELKDWAHIGTASDFLATKRIPLIWGPGRHGVGHNIFTYHHNCDDQIIELFTEMDRMDDEALGYFEPRPWHTDIPQRPKVWVPSPEAANLWGVEPPPAMLA